MAIKQDLDKVLASGYEAKVPDLDWASLQAKDTDNVRTENKVEVLPQLVEQLSNAPDKGARLAGFTEAPRVRKAAETSDEAVEEVVSCAKREMMKGLKGGELAEKLATMFHPSTIRAARDALSKVASEQGLLGNVYVDVSVFDSCREAAQVLGSNRARLADYVVGTPRKHVCASHKDGYCNELRKTAVAEVPYGDELFSKYTKHLRVAGIIEATEEVKDKDTLRDALLRTRSKKHETSIENPEKKAPEKDSSVTLEQAMDKAASSREAAQDRYASVRPVLAFMQDQMLRGVVGEDLKRSVGAKFPVETVHACRSEIKRMAGLQGLVGNVYVDVGLYKTAGEAVSAIATAKTRPSYLVNSSPEAEYDGRIASVAKATGCDPLPADGSIDRKVARTYIDDLMFSGRISAESAKKYSALVEAGRKPLAVLREAFLSNDRVNKSLKSAGQIATWFSGSRKGHEDRTALEQAAVKALESGLPTEKVQAKLAGSISTAEATGMIHGILSRMPVVDASCMAKCATERYPLGKSALIKKAAKCESCINCAGTACMKQGVKFAGVEEYDRAFFDMKALEASDKGEKKSEKKYDPKDQTSPEIKKVLLKDNPDAEREDMKQPYDVSDEIGSGGNKALDKMREKDEKESAPEKSDKKSDK
jgi:hypothetical protein